TLDVRYTAQSQNALTIAQWLEQQPSVAQVLFPALPSDPGHGVWKRDFKKGGCLFSLILRPSSAPAYSAFFASLQHIAIGASWGGVHSLAAFYPATQQINRQFQLTDQPIIRLSIGLEPVDMLKKDLTSALA